MTSDLEVFKIGEFQKCCRKIGVIGLSHPEHLSLLFEFFGIQLMELMPDYDIDKLMEYAERLIHEGIKSRDSLQTDPQLLEMIKSLMRNILG